MAHSYIDFKGRTARFHDGMITIVFMFLFRMSKDLYPGRKDLSVYFRNWKINIELSGPGLIDIDLRGYWETDVGKKLLVQLVNELINRLKRSGPELSSDFINGIVKFNQVNYGDVKTELVIKEASKFLNLLTG